jgi:hypothetical protein
MLEETSQFADIQLSPLDGSAFPEALSHRPIGDGVRLGRDWIERTEEEIAEAPRFRIWSLVGPSFRFLVSFSALFIVLYCNVPVVHRTVGSSYAAIRGHFASLLRGAARATVPVGGRHSCSPSAGRDKRPARANQSAGHGQASAIIPGRSTRR